MRIPFHSEFDEVFRGDRSVWLKMVGCALVTVFVVLISMARMAARGARGIELTGRAIVAAALVAAGIGALIGLTLALKDVVERRRAGGLPVNPVLRLYLGMRTVSLVVWFFTALVGGLVAAAIWPL